MNRRNFIQGSLATGVMGSMFPNMLFSAEYSGALWIIVNASGGYDPTYLFDPKGRLSGEDDRKAMNQRFMNDEIETIGAINYAPVGYNRIFLEKYGSKLLVVNGIDNQTNSHEGGRRYTWSGKLDEGNPSISALVSGAFASSKPMAFITNGGYDETFGVVGATRTNSSGIFKRIAFPNRIDPNKEYDDQETHDLDNHYHTTETQERISIAREAEMDERIAEAKLKLMRNAMQLDKVSPSEKNELKALMNYVPTNALLAQTNPFPNNSLLRQATFGIAGYKAGITAAININFGGFDTHGDHDNRQIPRQQTVLEGVDGIIAEAERQGVADKLVIAIGSDFGRTPGYNGGNGKDHWPTTSMMFLGQGIEGNRVVGSSTHRHEAKTVNPTTLVEDENGINITPAVIHKSFRNLAGLDEHEFSRKFPLSDVPLLPLFSPNS